MGSGKLRAASGDPVTAGHISAPPIRQDGGRISPRHGILRSTMTERALLLMAHGSRDAGARAEYVRLRQALAERLPGETVVLSVLEFPDREDLPSIQEGWRRCLAVGARRVVAVPFFLFPAGHVREDLPNELEGARQDG